MFYIIHKIPTFSISHVCGGLSIKSSKGIYYLLHPVLLKGPGGLSSLYSYF